MEQVKVSIVKEMLADGEIEPAKNVDLINHFRTMHEMTEVEAVMVCAAPQARGLKGAWILGDGWLWWGGQWYRSTEYSDA